MNRELLARVRDRIAEVGNEHCDMDRWFSGAAPLTASGEPACGTTGCIAGWTVAVAEGQLIENPNIDDGWCNRVAERAKSSLGLPSLEPFYDAYWPEHYRRTLRNEGDAKGMLAVCDALLDGSLTFDEDGNLIEAPED